MQDQNEKLLRVRQVMDATGLKKATLYATVAAGDFPRPVPIGPRMVAWLQSEVQAWIRERITASRGAL